MRALLLTLLAAVLVLPEDLAAAPVAAPTTAPTAALAFAPAMAAAPAPQRRGNSRRSVKAKPSRGKRGGSSSKGGSTFSKGPAIGDLKIFKSSGSVLGRLDLAGGASFGTRRARPSTPSDITLPTEAELLGWFDTSDADSSGWISYRETSHALGFDRSRYRRFDENRDGRVNLEEFELYCLFAITERTFRDPLPPADLLGAPARTPEQLRNAYDRDRDGLLSGSEVQTALNDYGRPDLVPERVVMGLDRDNDGRLNVSELAGLEGIVGVVSVSNIPVPTSRIVTDARSAEELFGVIEPRAEGSNAPPRIQGPVLPFRRLDLDNDGMIALSELEELLRPLFSSVRVQTVHHTLDVNLDGVLTKDEFENAIAATPLPLGSSK